jgi:signal peptidase I
VSETVDSSDSASRTRSIKLFFRDLLFIVLAAIVISFLIKTFLFRSFYIPSESMEPTLIRNDRILVNELIPSLFPLERGDVVVFRDPGNWLEHEAVPDTRNDVQKAIDSVLGVVGLAAPDSNDHLIKRVIGLPGDHVVCCDAFGHLSVNGIPLDEVYIAAGDGEDSVPSTFDIIVPDGKIWVLGDNRYHSADSAYHLARGDTGDGFVPVSNVVGRAFVITWPTSRWTDLDNFPGVFSGTDTTER